MTEFVRQDLTGARFDEVDLTGARFREVDLTGVTIRGAYLKDVDIDGDFDTVRINGVDVTAYVQGELDRRFPEGAALDTAGADTYRAAWGVVEQRWRGAVERARALPAHRLHERVDDEWSFIETLRHLIFATNAWALRAVLGRADPYTPLDLPHSIMEHDPVVPNDLTLRPSLDVVLAIRADRQRIVGDIMAGLTDEMLAGDTEPVSGPGYPEAGRYPVRRCLRAVINEEWWHRVFAERDLAVLERGQPSS